MKCVRSTTATGSVSNSTPPNLRTRTIEEQVEKVLKRLAWLKPELALEDLQKAHTRERARARKALLAKYGVTTHDEPHTIRP